MIIGQMAEMIRDLGADETCPICLDAFLIECPEHMVHTDDDGWCLTCDSPAAEPQEISCPCQDL